MRSEFETNLLDRVLDPLSRTFTAEAAQRIVDFRADPVTQQRMDELAEKCNDGSLSADEKAEYDAYISAANLLAILQSKARRALPGNAA